MQPPRHPAPLIRAHILNVLCPQRFTALFRQPVEPAAMTALKKQTEYAEGASWDNGNEYTWKGGTQGGIAAIGAGCVAFAYILSDAAFGDLPARMTSSVRFSDVKVGDNAVRA